jgi:hypothetical protein
VVQTSHVDRLLAGIIAAVVLGATTALVFATPSALTALRTHTIDVLVLFAVALGLQLLSLSIRGNGSLGVSAIAVVAAAAIVGTGAAMAIGCALAVAQGARRRGPLHKTLFDVGDFALAAGAAGILYTAVVPDGAGATSVLAGAAVAGAAYAVVNLGLLCAIMSAAERQKPAAIWEQRFEWAWFAMLAFGPLAGVAAVNYEQWRPGGVVSLLFLPLLLQLGMRGELEQRGGTQTRASVAS